MPRATSRTLINEPEAASLYAAVTPPGPSRPPLLREQRTKFAIVGGGYTGLSTALHLAEAGEAVTVLEARDFGWGASGRNGGQINPGLKYDPDTIENAFGSDLGGRMIALSYSGPDFVQTLVRRLGIECDIRQGGTLRAATSMASAEAVARSAADCRRRGMPVELLDSDALRQITGSTRYVSAMLDRRGGDLNPLAYVRGLAAAAELAGASLHAGTPALSLMREGRSWRIDTPDGVLRADRVLLATNGYTATSGLG